MRPRRARHSPRPALDYDRRRRPAPARIIAGANERGPASAAARAVRGGTTRIAPALALEPVDAARPAVELALELELEPEPLEHAARRQVRGIGDRPHPAHPRGQEQPIEHGARRLGGEALAAALARQAVEQLRLERSEDRRV